MKFLLFPRNAGWGQWLQMNVSLRENTIESSSDTILTERLCFIYIFYKIHV